MKVGVIGLGQMGSPIALKFSKAECQLTVYDLNPKVREEFRDQNINVSESIEELSTKSRYIWVMVPEGVMDEVLEELCNCITAGTIIVDGGNSYFKSTIKRAQELKKKSIEFLDCGTSGGVWGAKHGFSMTIGGEYATYKKAISLFKLISYSPDSYYYVGPSGAGHYVKMVHNGIEYALFQAYSEGIHVLRNGYYKDLDLPKICATWLEGAVIRSWILELIKKVLEKKPDFKLISGVIGTHGTGKWTVEQAHEDNIPVPVIEKALLVRLQTQKEGKGSFASKLIALLRNEMGNHPIEPNIKPQSFNNTKFYSDKSDGK